MEYLDWIETVAKDSCWGSEGANPGDRERFAYIAMNYEYISDLFDEAIRLAESDEAELGIKLYRRNFMFNYLMAVHSDMYIDGTEEERAEYTRLFEEFRDFAVQTGMTYITKELSVERNPAYAYEAEYGFNPGWWPLPQNPEGEIPEGETAE